MAVPQTSQAVRRWIFTAAITGITVTGTIYGAGLKTDREAKQVRLSYTHSIYMHPFSSQSHKKAAIAREVDTSLTVRQERKRYQQASPEEVISQLQVARDDLEMKKREMERKIAGFHEKRRLKEVEAQKLKDQQEQQQQQQQQPPPR
jgi:hypothetical protein